MTRLYAVSLLSLILCITIIGCSSIHRKSYETARYTTQQSVGAFEIRQYKTMNVASTFMGEDSEGNGSFMKLFRYISRANDQNQKIAMTTPVFKDMEQAQKRMYFVLPKEVSQSTIPQPNDKDVTVLTMPEQTYAVYRYSGKSNAHRAAEAEEKLQTWMFQQGLKKTGATIWAGYDPPWTPAFLRRNEILIPIESPLSTNNTL